LRKLNFEVMLSFILVFTSFILYLLIYLIFRGASSLMLNFLYQLAFLPIYILLVTIFLESLLNKKEQRTLIQKLNMLIGTFFNEFGRELLKVFFEMDNNLEQIKLSVATCINDNDAKYKYIIKYFKEYPLTLNISVEDFYKIKEFMGSKRELLLNLMSNPNLMEHEDFTQMLLAIFHLYQELALRQEIDENNILDFEHLKADADRAYTFLIKEWIAYLNHLKEVYPYLFSLEMRANPLNVNYSVEINKEIGRIRN
jgi:hypothetical protein